MNKIVIVAGALSTILGVGVAWNELRLPRPAMTYEVAEIENFSRDTRLMLLYDKYFKAQNEAETLEQQHLETEADRELLKMKKEQLFIIDKQIEELKKEE